MWVEVGASEGHHFWRDDKGETLFGKWVVKGKRSKKEKCRLLKAKTNKTQSKHSTLNKKPSIKEIALCYNELRKQTN